MLLELQTQNQLLCTTGARDSLQEARTIVADSDRSARGASLSQLRSADLAIPHTILDEIDARRADAASDTPCALRRRRGPEPPTNLPPQDLCKKWAREAHS